MLLSKLTKYLHRKSPKTSPKQPESSEVICVSSEEINNNEIAEEVISEAEPKSTTSHLTGSVPRRVETPKGVMTKAEMREARELFEGLDDAEIHRLYKKVTQ